MHRSIIRTSLVYLATPLSITAAALPIAPATAALPVFDAGNYIQNVVQAARALNQINNQIRSLQNETAMLTNMAKNLSHIDFPELDRVNQAMRQLGGLIDQARGMTFRAGDLERQFGALFPGGNAATTLDGRVAGAKAGLDAAMAALRATMGVQSEVVADVADDAQAVASLAARSQGAEGALQVGQATNQLLVLAAKQQSEIQTLMAAQYRAEALEQASRAQAQDDARAATVRFLGSGSAYPTR